MSVSGDFTVVQVTGKTHWYAFATVTTEPFKTSLTFSVSSHNPTFDTSACEVKLSVFVFDAGGTRVRPLFTSFLRLVPCAKPGTRRVACVRGFKMGSAVWDVVEHTAEVGTALRADGRRLKAEFVRQTRRQGITIPSSVAGFVHRDMVECELPRDFRVPCCATGWPQMNGLSAVTPQEAHESFRRCLQLAKCATGFREQPAIMLAREPGTAMVVSICETLFVCAMRMYAGVYPAGKEDIDDRSMGCLKLYTNSDCDDLAITVASFFNRLKAIWLRNPCPGGAAAVPFSWRHVLATALPRMADIFACQGHVATATANPNTIFASLWSAKTSGHVWCAIRRVDGTWMHVECTRCVGCHTVREEDTSVYFQAYAHTADESGLAACDPGRYKKVCAVYSHEFMWLPLVGGSKTAGVRYGDLLAGLCGEPVAAVVGGAHRMSPEVQRHIDLLRHRPSHAQLEQVTKEAPEAFLRMRGNLMPQALDLNHFRASNDGAVLLFGNPSTTQVVSDLATPWSVWSGRPARP